MHPEVRQVVEELNPAQLVLEACLCPAPDLCVATRNDRDMGYRN